MPGLIAQGGVRRLIREPLLVDGQRVVTREGLITVGGVRRQWFGRGGTLCLVAAYDHNAVSSERKYRVYSVHSDGTDVQELYAVALGFNVNGAALEQADDIIYGIRARQESLVTLATYDKGTGAESVVGNVGQAAQSQGGLGMAYNPATSTMYYTATGPSGSQDRLQLYTINLTNATRTYIGQGPNQVQAGVFRGQGSVWFDDTLYTIVSRGTTRQPQLVRWTKLTSAPACEYVALQTALTIGTPSDYNWGMGLTTDADGMLSLIRTARDKATFYRVGLDGSFTQHGVEFDLPGRDDIGLQYIG